MKFNLVNDEEIKTSVYSFGSLKAYSVELDFDDVQQILKNPEIMQMIFMRLIPGKVDK